MRNAIYYAVLLLLTFGASCTSTEKPQTADTPQAAQLAPPSPPVFKFRPCADSDETYLPAQCDGKKICTDTLCQDAILKRHQIDEKDFRTCLANYSATEFQGKRIAAASILADMKSSIAKCPDGYIVIYDSLLKPGNVSIAYLVDSMPKSGLYYSKYSTPFFKAIFDRKKPATFVFFKGSIVKGADTCDVIIFRALDAKGKQVYSGNVSSVRP